jgi:hypothetical protein
MALCWFIITFSLGSNLSGIKRNLPVKTLTVKSGSMVVKMYLIVL